MSIGQDEHLTMAYIRFITPGDGGPVQTIAINANTQVDVENSNRFASELQRNLAPMSIFNGPCVEVQRDTTLDDKVGLTRVLVRVANGTIRTGDHLLDRGELVGWVTQIVHAEKGLPCGESCSPHVVWITIHAPGSKKGAGLLAQQRLSVRES